MEVTGDIGTLATPSLPEDSWLKTTGGIKTLNITGTAGIGSGSTVSAEGTAGIGTITVSKGAIDGIIHAKGPIKTMTIGGTAGLAGGVTSDGAAGIGTITISKGGLDGTIEATQGGIKTLNINGSAGIAAGSTISAGGTAGIGTMNVKGSAPDLTVRSAGILKTLNLTAPSVGASLLGGIIEVNSLGTLNAAKTDAVDLVIATTAGIGKVALASMANTHLWGATMSSITVSKNVTNSALYAGSDYHGVQRQKAVIGTITIKGTMSGTDIVAGVTREADGWFGLHNGACDDSSFVGGTIKTVDIHAITATGSPDDSFGIEASTLGTVKVGGVKQTGLPKNVEDVYIATIPGPH